MSWLSRIRNTFANRRLNRDLDDEMRFHLEQRARARVANGEDPLDADRAVRLEFGSALQHREASSDIRAFAWLSSVFQDIRIGGRVLRKDVVAATAAVLSLAVAIGACTVAFSLIDALILRTLPVREPDKLIYLTMLEDAERDTFNYPLFERLRDASRNAVDLFAVGYNTQRRARFADSQTEEKAYTQYVSGDAFPLWGVNPALGRVLSGSDDRKPGEHPVAVISHEFWTRRFGASPSVIGQTLRIEETAFEIIGVARRGFTGVEPGVTTDVWVPTMMWRREALTQHGWSWFRIWGRLKGGEAAAHAPLQAVFANFRHERAATWPKDTPPDRLERYKRTPLALRAAANGPSGLRKQLAGPLWVLAGIVGLVLLIACFNVANLLLARGSARQREMALRMSIGAGRARLVRQLLVESAMLAAAGCVLGAVIARAAGPFLISLIAPPESSARLDLALDWRMLLFLAALGAVSTAIFGLAPAWKASAAAPGDALKSGSGKHSARTGLLRSLVGAQVAVCFVVLFLAGLFLQTFRNLSRLDVGFNARNLVLADVAAPTLGKDNDKALAAWTSLREHLRSLPGVEAVGYSGWALFSGSGWTSNVRLPGHPNDGREETHFLSVSPGFVEAMGMRILAGRDFNARDSVAESSGYVLVNEEFARRYFAGGNPVGKRFEQHARGNEYKQCEVIGLVNDARYRALREPPPPTVYVPLRADTWASVQVRTRHDAPMAAALLRAEAPKANPAFRVLDVTMQSRLLENAMVLERLLAFLSMFFAGTAVLLAAIGLFGVLSYGVTQRTREIGIRVALGARAAAVARLVLGQVAVVLICGLAAGLGVGLLLAGYLKKLLYGIQAADFMGIAPPLAGLLITGLIAAIPPMWRAIRVDPTVALRHE